MTRTRVALRRLVPVAALTGALGLALTGCQSVKPVPRAEVEAALGAQLARNLGEVPQKVACDGDLGGSKGSSQHCTFTDRDFSDAATVTVTDSNGNTSVSLDRPLPVFPAARLEASVAQDYQRHDHGTAKQVHCAASLSKRPGDHTTCRLLVGTKHYVATVSVGTTDATTGITSFSTSYAAAK